MKDTASLRYKILWLALPIGVSLWRLSEWLMLTLGNSWAYYLGEPIPVFWMSVLLLCTVAITQNVAEGWLRAGLFVWFAVIYGLLPTQAGSMAAHPDYFLEEAIDRVSSSIWQARQNGNLPAHPIDLKKMLQPSGSLHYRRGLAHSVALELRIVSPATGPVSTPAERPGVIHLAIEGPGKRMWISATGLGFARFNQPTLLPDRQGSGAVVIEIKATR